jgi:hypothetical protein
VIVFKLDVFALAGYAVLIVPCKIFPCAKDVCGCTELVIIPGPFEKPMFVVLVLNPPLPLILNDDDSDPKVFIHVGVTPYDPAAVDSLDCLMPDQEIPDDLGKVMLPDRFANPFDTPCGLYLGLPIFTADCVLLGNDVILRVFGRTEGSSIPFILFCIRCIATVNSCIVILPSRSRSDRLLQHNEYHHQ